MNNNTRSKASAFFLLIALYRQAQSLGLLRVGGRKPIATLVLCGICFVLHYFMRDVYRFLPFDPSFHASCVNAPAIWYDREWGRLLWAGFLHADDMHLHYNILSLLYKGVQLESRIGTPYFSVLSIALLLSTHALMVVIPFGLWYAGYGSALNSCAVGISGLLFALKTILNADDVAAGRTHSNVWGFTVPTVYVSWIELGLISLISPNASFMGHLCGILAGLIYVWFVRPAIDGRAGGGAGVLHGLTSALRRLFGLRRNGPGQANEIPIPPPRYAGRSPPPPAAHALGARPSAVAPAHVPGGAPLSPAAGDYKSPPAQAGASESVSPSAPSLSASSGAASSSAPASDVSVAPSVTDKVQQLVGMGFRDRRANLQALRAANFDVELAAIQLSTK